MSSRLVLKDVSRRFGDVQVLRNVRASVPAGKITAFLGPNGAGKTTLFHIISGVIAPDSGKVLYNDTDITGLQPHDIARHGIGRQFQEVRIFGGLSVLENVTVGLIPDRLRNAWGSLRGRRHNRAVIEDCQRRARRWLSHVGLEKHLDHPAQELSFGQQKLLTLACLFAKEYELLLLDEPTSGLSPAMVEQISTLVRRAVDEQGMTVLLVEHNMSVVADLAVWIHFLHEGRVAFSGASAHVLGNQSVRELYMGL